jgi:H+-transporting ATPase
MAAVAGYTQQAFLPFNPTTRRTEATVTNGQGTRISVMKGAPTTVLQLCNADAATNARAEVAVQELADRGFRSLAVATKDGSRASAPWRLVGLVSLFDPPRPDTVDTIAALQGLGIEVKMITGDNALIAKEVCRQVGLGVNVVPLGKVAREGRGFDVGTLVHDANGFAEALPEHKYHIVRELRGKGSVIGMTGDGVNDAPALKRADVGIAVEGATEAARAAADLVLTKPGLGVIVDAILVARRVFARMRAYLVYRVASTLQLAAFFFLSILTIHPNNPYFFGPQGGQDPALQHDTAFTLPVIAIIIIVILNDICAIAMSRDRVRVNLEPVEWQLGELTAVSAAMGLTQCAGTIILLVICLHVSGLRHADGVHVTCLCGV